MDSPNRKNENKNLLIATFGFGFLAAASLSSSSSTVASVGLLIGTFGFAFLTIISFWRSRNADYSETPNELLIAISGKFGSGKDTVAEILKSYYKGFTLLPFAGALKSFVALVGNIDVSILYTDQGKEQKNYVKEPQEFSVIEKKLKEIFGDYPFQSGQLENAFKETISFMDGTKSWGQTLQYVGTAVFREKIDNDFWIKVWKIQFLLHKDKGIIVTDLRFKNEAKLLKELNFQLWRVNAPLEERIKRIKTIRNPNHLSETNLDDYDGFDKIIENDSSLQVLEKKVKLIYIS